MYSLDDIRKGSLGLIGALIGLMILALAPTLLQQTSFAPDQLRIAQTRLIPLEEELIDTEQEMEPEPEPPPEPEILPDPPEIEPPEVDLPEIEPPQTSYDAAPENLPIGVQLPSLTSGLKGVKIAAGGVSAALAKAALPNLPKHGPPRIRFNSDEVDQQPQSVATMQPMYPYRAKRLGIEGEVQIRFLVDRTGKTSQVKILKATPPGEFDTTVEKTVTKWKFKPAVKDGRTVETWVETTIVFELN